VEFGLDKLDTSLYHTCRTLHWDNFDEHLKRICLHGHTSAAAPSDSVFRVLCTNLLACLLTYFKLRIDVAHECRRTSRTDFSNSSL